MTFILPGIFTISSIPTTTTDETPGIKTIINEEYLRSVSRYSFFPKYEPVRRHSEAENSGRQSRNIHMEYEGNGFIRSM